MDEGNDEGSLLGDIAVQITLTVSALEIVLVNKLNCTVSFESTLDLGAFNLRSRSAS